MKKQTTISNKIALNKITIAQLSDISSKESGRNNTDSETLTSYACKYFTMLKW